MYCSRNLESLNHFKNKCGLFVVDKISLNFRQIVDITSRAEDMWALIETVNIVLHKIPFAL